MLDLREYFGRRAALERKAKEFGVFWVRGGNAFVLRQAMRPSGFDTVLNGLKSRDDILNGGCSAGVCVLSPSLRGIDLNDLTARPYGRRSRMIWEGLGIIYYSVVSHYRSEHRETELAEKAVGYLRAHRVPFSKLRDGKVIIEDTRPVSTLAAI